MKAAALNLSLGGALGFSLSRIGYSSWDEVHQMFGLGNVRLLFTFGFAVMLLAVTWPLLTRMMGPSAVAPRPIQPTTLIGGALFGAGWAVCGACPAIAFVQLGEGKLAALITLLGIVLGNWLCGVLRSRYVRWDAGSCSED